MFDNKLKSLDVSYDEFLGHFKTNCAHVRLDFQCAIALCRGGFGNTPGCIL